MGKSYSHKTLTEKLGIKPFSKISILNAPNGFLDSLGNLENIEIYRDLHGTVNMIFFFGKSKLVLEVHFKELKRRILKDGTLWIFWPKATSKIKSDLNENIIRSVGLEEGLVDVKVISASSDWSGLKFVYRLEDRN